MSDECARLTGMPLTTSHAEAAAASFAGLSTPPQTHILSNTVPSPCPRPFRARRQALRMWCTWELYKHDCDGLRPMHEKGRKQDSPVGSRGTYTWRQREAERGAGAGQSDTDKERGENGRRRERGKTAVISRAAWGAPQLRALPRPNHTPNTCSWPPSRRTSCPYP